MRAQLDALQTCNRSLYDDPSRLGALPPAELLSYFASCWRGTWREFVPNALPYVCLRAWLAAGFRREQFLVVRSDVLRSVRASRLLAVLSNHTGLHYNTAVLHDREEELNVHCEAPDAATRRSAVEGAVGGGPRSSTGAKGPIRRRRAAAAPRRVPINTHSTYTGRDAEQRSKLPPRLMAELRRVADAHVALLDSLGLRELSAV